MTTNGRHTTNGKHTAPTARNVLGGPLATCSTAPLTGVKKRKAQSAERKTAGQSRARGSCSTALRFALQRLREAALEIVQREDLLRHAVDVAGGAL